LKLHEYQARDILARFGVPVPDAKYAETPEEARAAAESLGGKAVIKAQVHAGGRGLAGGVKLVGSADEAADVAKALIGTNLVTHQTGPEGAPVNGVLVAELTDIKTELYISIVVDAEMRTPVIMASQAGGMDIETVSAETPEKIVRVATDPVHGLWPYQARDIAIALGIPAGSVRSASALIMNLFKVFTDTDATLVEINPLVVTDDDQVIALDSKIDIEDDALFRHPDLSKLADPAQDGELERRANDAGLAYMKLDDGSVGCMVNGAGLAMATMDITLRAGTNPANFLDVGGGAQEDKIAEAFDIIVSDPDVKAVLVNIFGGILRCDIAARGVVQGATASGSSVPIVAMMRGTNAKEGLEILRNSELNVTFADVLSEAAPTIARVMAEAN
jgi:succinyl-CoA synthetase beta subunit